MVVSLYNCLCPSDITDFQLHYGCIVFCLANESISQFIIYMNKLFVVQISGDMMQITEDSSAGVQRRNHTILYVIVTIFIIRTVYQQAASKPVSWISCPAISSFTAHEFSRTQLIQTHRQEQCSLSRIAASVVRYHMNMKIQGECEKRYLHTRESTRPLERTGNANANDYPKNRTINISDTYSLRNSLGLLDNVGVVSRDRPVVISTFTTKFIKNASKCVDAVAAQGELICMAV